MSTKTKKAPSAPRRPEKKWGPFAGGVGVAVWLNEADTEQGKKFFRSNVAQTVMWRGGISRWQIECLQILLPALPFGVTVLALPFWQGL